MLKIVKGDITELEVDAIVNAANSELIPGGGVDGAIHDAAGPGLKNEVRSQHNYLAPGGAIITSAYHLPAKYVIHTVAPNWLEHSEEDALNLLYSCYNESLSLALQDDIHSVAFPSLGTGAFGIPIEKAMPVALSAIAAMLGLTAEEGIDLQVTICCYTTEDFEAYMAAAEAMGAQELDDDGNPVEKPLPNCPQCFHGLKKIVYGMIAPGPDTEDVILGGCLIMGDDPSIGCSNCGWSGDADLLTKTSGKMIFATVDEETNRFAGGASFETAKPRSFMVLVPGSPEFHPQGSGLIDEQIESCAAPSFWLAPQQGLARESLAELVGRYRTITADVMRFLGYVQLEKPPLFEDIEWEE